MSRLFDAFKDGAEGQQAKPQTLIEEMLAALTLAEPTLIARSPFSTALPAVRKAIQRAKEEASGEVDAPSYEAIFFAALKEIETICLESNSDFRKRRGTRVGNILETVHAAFEIAGRK